MATGDFVTLATVTTAYPRLSADQLADLPQLISAISAEIAGRYPKAAPRATWDETHDPGVHRTITLQHRPVLRINRIRADLAAVLRVAYTGAARRALVEIVTTGEADAPLPTSLVLTSESGGVVSTVATLLFSGNLTVQALATAVTAVGSGWSAAVSPTQGTMASADVEPLQGPLSALGGGMAVYGYTRDLTDYRLTDPRNGELLLYETRADSYRDPDRMWGTDPRACTVRANYDVGRNVVTQDVQRAAIIIIGAAFDATDKPGVVNWQAGAGYEYRLGLPTYRFPDMAERILSRYKNRRFS